MLIFGGLNETLSGNINYYLEYNYTNNKFIKNETMNNSINSLIYGIGQWACKIVNTILFIQKDEPFIGGYDLNDFDITLNQYYIGNTDMSIACDENLVNAYLIGGRNSTNYLNSFKYTPISKYYSINDELC